MAMMPLYSLQIWYSSAHPPPDNRPMIMLPT